MAKVETWIRFAKESELNGFMPIPHGGLGTHIVMLLQVDANDSIVGKWFVVEDDYTRYDSGDYTDYDVKGDTKFMFRTPEEALARAERIYQRMLARQFPKNNSLSKSE